jgi:futalosine hydrolase
MSAPAPSLGSPELVLVPTPRERALLVEAGLPRGLALLETCGFGPVAAAARTAELLARLSPRRLWLVGIAGTFDEARLPLATARAFDSVAIDGLGAGRGPGFRGPLELRLPQWPGSETSPPIEDELALACPDPARGDGALLLSVSSASATPEEAAERRRRFPRALAEDMEGFAVALAAALAGVPLVVVRGISNRVGDRQGPWRIGEAMAAARRTLLELLLAPGEARP